MNQIGNGALSAEAIAILRTGAFSFVSRPSPLVIVDTSKITTPLDLNALQQVFLYFGTIGAMDVPPDQCFTLVHLASAGHKIVFSPDAWQALGHASPIRINPKAILLSTSNDRNLREFLRIKAARMVEYNTKKKLQLVYADLHSEWNKVLDSLNISRYSLPHSLGGHLKEDFFSDFIRQRITIENCMGSAPPIANSSLVVPFEGQSFFERQLQQQQQSQHTVPSQDTIGHDTMVTQSKQFSTRKRAPSKKQPVDIVARRERNVMYQRNWQLQQYRLKQNLQENYTKERARRSKLLEENERLLKLLEEANQVIIAASLSCSSSWNQPSW